MFIGQTLVAENYDDGGTPQKDETVVYTPWFPRGGNAGVFTAEVLALSMAASDASANSSVPMLEMTVQEKKTEEDDGDANNKGNDTVSQTGLPHVLKVDASGFEELVRLRFRLYDEEEQYILVRTFYAVFRALNPSWSTN